MGAIWDAFLLILLTFAVLEPLLEANHEGGTFREWCHFGTYLVNVCTTFLELIFGTLLN